MDIETLHVPTLALRYLLFQRGEVRRFQMLSARYPVLYQYVLSFAEALVWRHRIVTLYWEWLLRDYQMMREHLPEKASRVLDVGCGIAGIDAILFQHYSCSGTLEICLLDKTGVARRICYGFQTDAAFYNSLAIAKRLLVANGVNADRVHTFEATEKSGIPIKGADLVLSLYSWGFHYPVTTYLGETYLALKDGGKLILDIRKGTGGEEEVAKRFGNGECIGEPDNKKTQRFVFIKSE